MSEDVRIEHITRVFRRGAKPGMVGEYVHLSMDQRLELFLQLGQRVIEDRYGADPGFEKVCAIVRRT